MQTPTHPPESLALSFVGCALVILLGLALAAGYESALSYVQGLLR